LLFLVNFTMAWRLGVMIFDDFYWRNLPMTLFSDRSRFFRVPGLVAAVALLWLAPAVQAGTTGFNNGTGWSSNSFGSGSAAFTTSTLTLTDGGFGEARSAYFNTAQPVANWSALFTYTASGPGGLGLADGVSFILQNQGLTAVGGGGSGLGMSGITPSAEVEFNLFTGFGHPVGTTFETNGADNQNYMTTGSVNIASGDPIRVSLSYSGSLLSETLQDLSTSATFSTSYTTNLVGVLGSPTALIGFTGGTGAGTSVQVISNFSFSNSALPEPSSLLMAVTGAAGLALYGLWRRRPVAR
jgi:hypothetical protein